MTHHDEDQHDFFKSQLPEVHDIVFEHLAIAELPSRWKWIPHNIDHVTELQTLLEQGVAARLHANSRKEYDPQFNMLVKEWFAGHGCASLRTIQSATGNLNRAIDHIVRHVALHDLRSVGESKAMGHLPYAEISKYRLNLRGIKAELEDKGLQCVVMTPSRYGKRAALIAFHVVTLIGILQRNEGVLQKAGWPSDPVGFVKNVALIFVQSRTPLHRVISEAYGDHENMAK